MTATQYLFRQIRRAMCSLLLDCIIRLWPMDCEADKAVMKCVSGMAKAMAADDRHLKGMK